MSRDKTDIIPTVIPFEEYRSSAPKLCKMYGTKWGIYRAVYVCVEKHQEWVLESVKLTVHIGPLYFKEEERDE